LATPSERLDYRLARLESADARPRRRRLDVIVLLACIAALLYFPTLRHAVRAFMFGALALVSLTLLFGEVGAGIALAVGLVALYRR
jgi:hypothetical protein